MKIMKDQKAYLRYSCVLALLMLLAAAAGATTIVMPTDAQLVEKSPFIVVGRVVSSAVVERHGGIWTETAIEVERAIRGNAAGTIVVSEIGGRIGDRETVVFGGPDYREGERVLLFLSRDAAGRYRTKDLFVGKFTERIIGGETIWHRDDAQARTNLLDARLQPLSVSSRQRRAAAFESFIVAELEGRSSSIDYRMDVPRSRISEDFSLIAEPTLYRWFAFDTGGSASWRSHGTQTGYSDGGLTEMRTGMNAWTNYTDARIRYVYSGTGSGAPGGLSTPNGVNEIIFGDVLNEVEGSWDGRSGVVGRGGFNNVRGGGSWTSPFAADASHPATTYPSTGNILEGNLVIQDGVSPSRGISSSALAEILAHEFGHTLGFGHSLDGTALMYSSVTGLGPSLRADDRTAARWLYPTGGTTEPNPTPNPTPPPPPAAPAAPSNLVASLLGSDVRLDWTDNATNETMQHIYLSTGGAFSREGTIGPGVTSVRVSGLRPGMTYSFRVTAANDAGESAMSNVATIAIPASAAVQAGFNVSPSTGVAGVTMFLFTDASTGPIARRSWSFGDGATSGETNPSYRFATAGNYTVTLTVFAADNTQSSTSRTISVMPAQPALEASFNWNPQSPTTNDNIQFSDASSGATSWSWNFGDGTSSNQRHPLKRYSAGGVYNVTLTVGDGSRTASRTAAINVASGAPAVPLVSAEFDVPASARADEEISFLDRSMNATAWQWSFGDGATSTLQNPRYRYRTPGTYRVSLVASNAGGSSTRSREIVISAAIGSFESLVPVSAQTAGAGGTDWRTELTIFNAGSTAANVDITFVPSAGGMAQLRQTSISAGTSVTFFNALRDLYGIGSGAGALTIASRSVFETPNLRISSRTFTDSASGTYGQFVPDVAKINATTYLTALESNASYRTNIGLVNRSSAPATVTLSLFEANGAQLGGASMTLGASSFQQSAVTALFPQLAGRSLSGMSLRAQADRPDAVAVYASTIDNRTQDPIYQPAVAATSGSHLTIPAVGRTAGAGSTFWRSDVALFNPSTVTQTLSIAFLPQGTDNRNAPVRTLTLQAGTTTMIPDILTWLGAGNGSGALRLEWNGGSGPVVTSRTYTGRSDGGTYGQSIDPFEDAAAGTSSIVTGLRSDSQFRSNAGFVNASTAALNVRVVLLNDRGFELGSAVIGLAPRSQMQASLATLFPSINVATLGHVTIRSEADRSGLFTYASVVDNISGDPIFISGR